MTLRSRFVTRWNRHCTRILHQLLPKLEEHLSLPPLHEHHAELSEITATFKVQGVLYYTVTCMHEMLCSIELSRHEFPPCIHHNNNNYTMQVTGFPIHLRYSDIQHIVSTVERTGIHLCEDQKVEYALAVYVHPYPNDVLSVWLYIASLVPN